MALTLYNSGPRGPMDDVKPRLTTPPQRDPDYYDDDGNVVFCAQDVLFRVRGARETQCPASA